jgi:uncharacterized protein involved in exopolysaccharide biosynthesis
MTQLISGDAPGTGEQISLGDIAAFARRRWRTIASTMAVLLLAVVLTLLIRGREYTSSASFAPQSNDKLSALAGLAAQFGVTAGGPDVTESPAFYVDLLRSREILSTILLADYRITTDKGVVTTKLIDAMKVKEPTEGRRLDKAMEKLNDRLETEQKSRTGVVTVRVQLKDPQLAQQVVQRLIDEVSRFSLTKRNAKAAAERKFTEGRIVEIRQELREAEDRLQSFLQRNRDYRNSPELTFQHGRISQEVDFLRTIYINVSQSNERARMEEARDTPVLMIVERPNLPPKADPRGLARFGALALILGGLIGIGIGFAQDLRDRRRGVTHRALSSAA